jgi:hypothetical protein
MNKFFTVLLAGLFVFAAAVPASATDARLASLAYGGNYLEDDYNIFTWYGTLPSYSNMVWIGMQDLEWDEGDEMFYFMGASYGLGEDGKYGTLAMFYYDYAPGLNPFGYSDGMWPGAGLFGWWLPSKFTMMYGYAMEKMSLGLYFSRADEMAKYTEDEASAEYKHAYTTFGAGLRFDLGEKAYMDVAADLSLASYKEEETSYGDINQDANKMYGFRARMFYEWNETITWVPYFNFRMFDFNLKADEEGFELLRRQGHVPRLRPRRQHQGQRGQPPAVRHRAVLLLEARAVRSAVRRIGRSHDEGHAALHPRPRERRQGLAHLPRGREEGAHELEVVL